MEFKKKTATEAPPNPKRMIEALRQIGYSLEQSIADLVDNSINAEAGNVLIRFVTKGEKIESIIIADDGHGMSATKLADAMKFGSEDEAAPESLGKYGMGLKLASLSFAKSLTVISRRANKTHAMRWTIKGISSGWLCDVLDETSSKNYYDSDWSGLDISRHGTLVIWDSIDKLATGQKGLQKTLRTIRNRLSNHIGLCFHRFIEDGSLNVFVDVQQSGEEIHRIRDEIYALNPFAYPVSGHQEFPKKLKSDIDGVGTLILDAHIWPANSDEPQYKLGGRTSARQGFYFYRNNRLIQAGGWNGVVQDESEPHGSLARIKVDLPPRFDKHFGLNVQKSAVIVPPAFVPGVQGAHADDGDTIARYRRKADSVYRKKDTGAIKHRPMILGEGVPKSVAKAARAEFSPSGERTRRVDFRWEYLSSGDVFKIDQANDTIVLNKIYRKSILCGMHPIKTDVPLFKTLIFFLAKEDINRSRMSGKRKEELDSINRLLAAAIKLEKG